MPVLWGLGSEQIALLPMAHSKDLNVYELIDEAISDLLALELEGIKRVNVKDVLQFILELDSLIPESVIDGDELVKHFNKKQR